MPAGLRELVSDPGVLTSIGVTLACLLVSRAWRPQSAWGTGLPVIAGLIAGLAVARASDAIDGDRYLSWPTPTPTTAGGVLIALVAVAAGAAAVSVATAADDEALRTHLAMGLAVVGVFLVVPETDVLRLVPGPMGLAALAAWSGMAAPLRHGALASLAVALGWIVMVDGVTRGSALVGSAACLMLPLLVRWGPGARLPVTRVVGVLALVMVGCARLGGVHSSTVVAAVVSVAVFGAGYLALRFAASVQTPTAGPAPSPAPPLARGLK